MEKMERFELCNGVWCKCPVINIITKEEERYIRIDDDFGFSVLFLEEHAINVPALIEFKNVHDSLYTLSDCYGHRIVVTKTDVELIQDYLKTRREGVKDGKGS